MNDPVTAALRGIAIIMGVGSAIFVALMFWEYRNQRRSGNRTEDTSR
jgi:hypothetical protein